MPSYTVREIKAARPWSKDGGEPTRIYYDFLVEGEELQINMGRKPGNPLKVGDVLDGTLSPGDRGNGLKFTPAGQQFGGGGGGGRGRSPEDEARTRHSIQMQHAQKCAVDALRLAAEFGVGEQRYIPPNAADVVTQVKLIAAGLFQQIEEVSA